MLVRDDMQMPTDHSRETARSNSTARVSATIGQPIDGSHRISPVDSAMSAEFSNCLGAICNFEMEEIWQSKNGAHEEKVGGLNELGEKAISAAGYFLLFENNLLCSRRSLERDNFIRLSNGR